MYGVCIIQTTLIYLADVHPRSKKEEYRKG